jgi:LysM repeat protein
VPGVGSSYDVRANDSLTKIAAAFEITLASLEAANPQVTDPNAIDVGQNLHIPICPNSKCESIGTYVVKTGDTFYLLAQQYKTTPGQIEVVNVGVVPENVPAGATIILPQNCHNVTAAC